MFFERVNEQLMLEGFRKVSIEQAGLFVYEGMYEGEGTYIIFVNLPEPIPDSVHNIVYSLQHLKMQLNNLNPMESKFLFVYLTDQPVAIRWMCQQPRDTHWILDRTEGKLIVYENQDTSFGYVQNILEEILAPKSRVKKKFTSYVTAGLVCINVLVFFIMYVILSSEQREVWVNYGGLYWPSIINKCELWRFLTSIFIHFGIEHLINNMVLLFFVGSYLEEYIGHVKFATLYFGSGILAGVVSMGYNSFSEKLVISCGASGAIFGIVGALVYYILFAKGMIKDLTGPRVIVFTVLSVLSGIGVQGVDNMAHFGGLVSGFLLALIITLCMSGKNRKVRV